jgi:hypothetical protein
MVSERIKVHVGLAAALIILIVCVGLLIAGSIFQDDLRAALPGTVAPDFALRDAADRPVELADLRGNVVIVYFRGQNTDDGSNCPTSVPIDSMTSQRVATRLPPTAAAVQAIANKNLESASATDLPALSAMCRKHSRHVKVLDLESSLSLANAGPPERSQQTDDCSVQTLLDPAGEVAREYKIDGSDTRPTFVVIDPAGVIRYRGNSRRDAGNLAAGQLLAPTTQASGHAQMVETILSSEAIEAATPLPAHF